MKISEEIIHLVKNFKFINAPVTKAANLYIDLGYDSLEFIYLLTEIEKIYSIRFELMEIGMCLQIDQLINLVQKKIVVNKYD